MCELQNDKALWRLGWNFTWKDATLREKTVNMKQEKELIPR